MKRHPLSNFEVFVKSRIRKIYPLVFWHRCQACDQEFRRENGWRVITGWVRTGEITSDPCYIYYCMCTTPQEIYDKKVVEDFAYGED